jgi:hypothetical protein
VTPLARSSGVLKVTKNRGGSTKLSMRVAIDGITRLVN